MRPLTLQEIRAIEVPSPVAPKPDNWYLTARRAYELRRACRIDDEDTAFLYEMLHYGEPCCCDIGRINRIARATENKP